MTTYLVWSNEHRMWWRANGSGYTHALWVDAGRYTAEDADRRCPESIRTSHAPGLRRDVPVAAPELDAESFTPEQIRSIPAMLVRRAAG